MLYEVLFYKLVKLFPPRPLLRAKLLPYAQSDPNRSVS
jgi:hypothetical protein